MPRKPVRSKKILKPQLSDSMRFFIEYGRRIIFDTRRPVDNETFRAMGWSIRRADQREKLRNLWLEHRETIMSDWRKQKKKGRPWLSKLFEKNK